MRKIWPYLLEELMGILKLDGKEQSYAYCALIMEAMKMIELMNIMQLEAF